MSARLADGQAMGYGVRVRVDRRAAWPCRQGRRRRSNDGRRRRLAAAARVPDGQGTAKWAKKEAARVASGGQGTPCAGGWRPRAGIKPHRC
jgi:hypothetical protein